MKLKFFQDAVYNGQLLYRTGDIVEIDDKHGMATRWLVRGKAKVFVEPIVKEVIIEVPIIEEAVVESLVLEEILVPFCQVVEEEIVPVVEPLIPTDENQSIAIKSQKVETTRKGKKKI